MVLNISVNIGSGNGMVPITYRHQALKKIHLKMVSAIKWQTGDVFQASVCQSYDK